jgi:hypothetical protein
MILSKIIYPNKQLNIDLSWSSIEDVSSIGNVHTLDLQDCKNIRDVSSLGNVHTLDL